MKLSHGLAYICGALLATSTVASPLGSAKRADTFTVYTLRVVTDDPDASLNGKYLGLSNNTVGIFAGAAQVQFYTAAGRAAGLYELHTYPVGIVDHQLGLVGADGLLDLTDLAQPDAASFPDGTDADWRSFTLGTGADGSTNGPDGSGDNLLSYAGSRGRWLAFPAAGSGSGSEEDWEIKWYDGNAFVTQDYIPVDIAYETVTEDGKPTVVAGYKK